MKIKMVILVFFIVFFGVSCKKVEITKKAVDVIETPRYEKVENMDSENFDKMFSYIENNVKVFDIAEVHEVIFTELKKNINLESSSLDDDLEIEIAPFVKKWKLAKIRKLLKEKNVKFSEVDVNRYDELINIDDVIDFIVVYEKNALKMSRK
ncbi:hypothetical protein [Helicovermis profundi]|uniref:Uncharacterized protein n=1 Tax=Helicovermis profundi TaxID=3065157 RepID=A0AAU9ERR0_9FIRM|nr:hypothetical protein HLPR_23970 [Clostridia bacterium S502]